MKEILGADISHYQSHDTFLEILNSGDYKFVIQKALQGKDAVDKTFLARSETIKQYKDILWGIYHFFSTYSSPEEQAAAFLQLISQVDVHSLLVVDLEKYKGNLPKLPKVEIFVNQIIKATGIRPVIYGNAGDLTAIIQDNNSILLKCPLWIANYTNNPSPKFPNLWKDYVIWQYTDTPFDKNYFKGSAEGLKSLWQAHGCNFKQILQARTTRFFTPDLDTPSSINTQSLGLGKCYGFDLSKYQEVKAFQELLLKSNQDDFQFGFHKAQEGVTATDDKYRGRTAFAKALAAILEKKGKIFLWGAYHILSSQTLPTEQAKAFLNQVERFDITTLLALQLNHNMEDNEKQARYAEDFIRYIEKEKGIKPLLYGNLDTFSSITPYLKKDSILFQCPLWIAHWTEDPSPRLPQGWKDYTVWQHKRFYNQFNGTKEQLIPFWRNHSIHADLLSASGQPTKEGLSIDPNKQRLLEDLIAKNPALPRSRP